MDGFVDELKCAGELYHSANVMKCEFYPLAYKIECHESTFSVLTKFRTKDITLDKDCYGLIQANMTWGLPILTDMADCEVLERFRLSRADIQWLVDELGEEYSKKLPALCWPRYFY